MAGAEAKGLLSIRTELAPRVVEEGAQLCGRPITSLQPHLFRTKQDDDIGLLMLSLALLSTVNRVSWSDLEVVSGIMSLLFFVPF